MDMRHLLAEEPAENTPAETTAPAEHPASGIPGDTRREDDGEEQEKDSEAPHYTSTTTTTRRNANGSVSSVYSGNKIKHLKKEDGIPLWRKDIQYDFLRLVFYDEQRVFTRFSDGSKGHTFAEIYIDAMAKSSKTSKILKEKLVQDHSSAISMAMVCLLVNVGRMNTTLNFFPEMRAQLRTYHSIPALQAHQDPTAYKQLQDAPRLKSILKGATEDEPQPMTIEEIRTTPIPRTNPVNLIFVLSQYAPKISEVHFTPPRDFFDLVMRPSLSSKSRATAFLWLIWWYLESNFTNEDAVRNPFGRGQEGEGTAGLPIKVPTLEILSEEQAALENVDSEEEKLFGEVKRKERIAILASEPSPAMTALKRARTERRLQASNPHFTSDHEGSYTPSAEYQSPGPAGYNGHPRRAYTDSDHTRSPSPPATGGFQAVNAPPKHSGMKIASLLDAAESPTQFSPAPSFGKKGPGRGNWRRNRDKASTTHPLLPNTAAPGYGFVHESPAPHTPAQPGYSTILPNDGSSFAPPSSGAKEREHIPTPSYQSSKRSRPLTHHQQSLAAWRKRQVEDVLETQMRERQQTAKRKREREGVLLRAWKRISMLPSGWDSEDDGETKSGNGKEVKGEDKEDKNKDEKNGNVVVAMAGFVMAKAERERERKRGEEDDIGEEAGYYAHVLKKAVRRVDTWDAHDASPDLLPKRWPVEVKHRRSKADRAHGKAENALAGEDGAKADEGAAKDGEDEADREKAEAAQQLDDEDRDILGEVDAEEDEEEEDQDEGEEDGEGEDEDVMDEDG